MVYFWQIMANFGLNYPNLPFFFPKFPKFDIFLPPPACPKSYFIHQRIALKNKIFLIFANEQNSLRIIFSLLFFTPSKKVWPNLKLYYERSLSEFYENGKQKLPSTTNDWENYTWSWCQNLFWEIPWSPCNWVFFEQLKTQYVSINWHF